jgi:hypothetical protein
VWENQERQQLKALWHNLSSYERQQWILAGKAILGRKTSRVWLKRFTQAVLILSLAMLLILPIEAHNLPLALAMGFVLALNLFTLKVIIKGIRIRLVS